MTSTAAPVGFVIGHAVGAVYLLHGMLQRRSGMDHPSDKELAGPIDPCGGQSYIAAG
jgi:hypothetical protein